MRCTMATAVVNWIRDDVAPEVAKLGSEIRTLDNFDSYECRGRNGVPGAHLSEHGKANAIDVHGFKLADGRMIELTDRTQPRELREAVLHSACTRFPTVLGPDSDGYHEDHIHLDLIERRSNYRICQWDVLDPLPKVAPLLPEKRPDDAPPREVAAAGAGEGPGGCQAERRHIGESRQAGDRIADRQSDGRSGIGSAATCTIDGAGGKGAGRGPAKDKPSNKLCEHVQGSRCPACARQVIDREIGRAGIRG